MTVTERERLYLQTSFYQSVCNTVGKYANYHACLFLLGDLLKDNILSSGVFVKLQLTPSAARRRARHRLVCAYVYHVVMPCAGFFFCMFVVTPHWHPARQKKKCYWEYIWFANEKNPSQVCRDIHAQTQVRLFPHGDDLQLNRCVAPADFWVLQNASRGKQACMHQGHAMYRCCAFYQ